MCPNTQYGVKVFGLILSKLIHCHRSKKVKIVNGHAASNYIKFFFYLGNIYL